MRSKFLVPLVVAGALVATTAIVVKTASATDHPELTARYTETSLWDGGLLGGFTIRNPSSKAISDWNLSFALPGGATVLGVWNATLSESNGEYRLRPVPESRSIAGRGSLLVGLTVKSAVHVTPVKCVINGTGCVVEAQSSGAGSAVTAKQPAAAGAEAAAGANVRTEAGAAAGPGASGPGVAPLTGTIFSPRIDVASPHRPTLAAIAATSHASLLTLAGAVPRIDGGCELTWGGIAGLGVYTKEITDALKVRSALAASIGTVGGVDLMQACGSAAAATAQLSRIVGLGVRTIDFTISAAQTGGAVVDDVRAQAVAALRSLHPDVTVTYTLATAVGAGPAGLDALTAPLAAAKRAGAIIDRVNILPLAPSLLGSVESLLGSILRPDSSGGLLDLTSGVHERIMKLLGVDTATAWRMLGIVPVIGGDELLGRGRMVESIGKLVAFARANGLGLLGFIPLLGNGSTCGPAATEGQGATLLPGLGCLDPTIVSRFFAVSELFNRGLR